jgi:4-amino-4-deoxy-L-arabinose transferase-like glycosyltransferase
MAVLNRRRARAVLRGRIFVGDLAVWRWSALLGIPLAAVVLVWCLVPRAYYTGTSSVNALTITGPAQGHERICQAAQNIPAGTRRVQLVVASGQTVRPGLSLTVRTSARTVVSRIGAATAIPGQFPRVDFPIPDLTGGTPSVPATLCVRATGRGAFALGVTPTAAAFTPPLRLAGAPTLSRLAVWYLPASGARRSYLAELGTMLRRASLFAPGFSSPVLLGIVIVGLLPLIAILAVRCLAAAAAGRVRRLGLWIYVLALLNAASWSLITPPFQAPDEVDHFAYVQSVAENGLKPTPYANATQARWSTSETDALLATGMLTDHQAEDSRAPGLRADVRGYQRLSMDGRAPQSDGGGNETTAAYGPLYYLALTPGYFAAPRGSVFTQLGLTRLISAIIGAFAALFTFLLLRELVPRRPWTAVLAGLLVAFQPMYGFLSGALNNDIGLAAGSAAVAWLLVRLLRRGPRTPELVAVGVLLGALPFVKESAYDLFPLAGFVVLAGLWRARAWRAGQRLASTRRLGLLLASIAVPYVLGTLLNRAMTPAPPPGGGVNGATTTSGALSAALHAPLSYLGYLWEVFLPRVSGLAPHFVGTGYPAQTIFIKRGWAAFGWYDTFFPGWVYRVLDVAMLVALVLGVVSLIRNWGWVRRRVPETLLVILFPIVVIAAFEAVFYTAGARGVIAEMGRYVFPALAPLAALAVGALWALRRSWILPAGALLLATVLAFSYASQLLTFTAFFS